MDTNLANAENSTFFNITDSVSSICNSYKEMIPIIVIGVVDWTLTLPSASWALWLLIKGSHLTLENELYVFVLICVDMYCVLISVGTYLNDLFWLSQIVAVFGQMMYFLCLYAHPVVQCCVCLERYLAVVHPVTFLKYRPMRYKAAVLALVWPVILALSLAHYFSNIPYILLATLIPVFCLESFCSHSILRVLKNSGPGDEVKKIRREREGKKLIKNRAFVIVVILQIKLLVNYLPYITVTLINNAFSAELYNCYLYQITISICAFGNFIQSFLYLRRPEK